MKHAYALLLLGTMGTGLGAQPVLDLGNAGTVPGDGFLQNACPWVAPGTPGAMQTWDFSTLSSDSVIGIFFADPDTTPDAASFPSATVASGDTGFYSYIAMTGTGGEFLGFSIPGQSAAVYSNPMQIIQFPSTYNTAWTDSFAVTFTAGFPIVRSGAVTATADGYGTLIMPYGQLSDVLRITYVQDFTDASIVTITHHQEYTDFMQAGTHYPILHIFSNTTTILGNTTTITGAQWLTVNASGTGPDHTTASVRAWPLPATDVLNVEISGILSDGTCMIELMDAAGRLVRERNLPAARNARAVELLSVDDLVPGAYTLRVRAGADVVVKPVMVQ